MIILGDFAIQTSCLHTNHYSNTLGFPPVIRITHLKVPKIPNYSIYQLSADFQSELVIGLGG